jgi:thiamine-monophosphate kinase
MGPMGEFDFIRWLRERTPTDPRVLVGPGDDAAVLAATHTPLLVTTDMLMDGVDFRLEDVDPVRVGRKAMGVNLSDLAAMGAKPLAAVVSVALPRSAGTSLAKQLHAGLAEMAAQHDCPIVGGDTNSWDKPLVISVTAFGVPGPQGPILRSGARPGDWLVVTGALGGSILGRHLDVTPRIAEAIELQRNARLHAMIDISDGLAADVHHLVEESGCGLVLDADSIPIHDDARRMNDGRSPLDHALSDGEDFELAFAVSPEDGARLVGVQLLDKCPVARIGRFVAERGLWIQQHGERRPLPPQGWVHRFEENDP